MMLCAFSTSESKKFVMLDLEVSKTLHSTVAGCYRTPSAGSGAKPSLMHHKYTAASVFANNISDQCVIATVTNTNRSQNQTTHHCTVWHETFNATRVFSWSLSLWRKLLVLNAWKRIYGAFAEVVDNHALLKVRSKRLEQCMVCFRFIQLAWAQHGMGKSRSWWPGAWPLKASSQFYHTTFDTSLISLPGHKWNSPCMQISFCSPPLLYPRAFPRAQSWDHYYSLYIYQQYRSKWLQCKFPFLCRWYSDIQLCIFLKPGSLSATACFQYCTITLCELKLVLNAD